MIDEVQRYAQTGQDQLENDVTRQQQGADSPALFNVPVRPQPQAAPAPQQQPIAQPQPEAPPQPEAQPAQDQPEDPITMLRKSLEEGQPQSLDDAIQLLNERLNQDDNTPKVPMSGTPRENEKVRREAAKDASPLPEGAKLTPLNPEAVLTMGDAPAEVGAERPYNNLEKAWRRMFGTDVNDPLMWTRTGTTLAGGVGGGIAGASIPGPPIVRGAGAAIGGFLGTVSGAAAPEMTLSALESMGILKPGTRDKMGLSSQDLYQVIEGEALLDIYMMGGLSAARLGTRGLTNLFTGANRQTRAMAEAGLREGIALMPVQVGERSFARGFVSIMGHFPFIAGPLRRGGEASVERIGRMFEGIPERLGPLSTFDEATGQILRENHATAEAVSAHFTGEVQAMYAQAGRQQLVVRPVSTDTVTKAVLAEIDRITPTAADGGRYPLPRNVREVRDFLANTTARLYTQATPQAAPAAADQTLRQMDTMVTSIEQQIQRAGARSDVNAIQWLDRVRQAIQSDMITHVLGPGGRADPAARQFMQNFAALDARQSETIAELFGNATARKIGAQISPNQRAAMFLEDRRGQTENLARVLVDSGGPQMVDELARTVSPDAMRRLSNAVFGRAVNEGLETTDVAVRFDVNKFAERLGLDAPNSTRFRQTDALMHHSGGMTMEQLQQFVDIARHVDGVELPNVSRFIARRATFGGIGTVFRSFAIGAAALGAGGATAKVASGSYQGGLMGIVAMYGGARMISSMISNPTSARALSRAFDVEASNTVRRAAWIRAAMGTTGDLAREGWHSDEVQSVLKHIREGFNEFDNMVKKEQHR